MVDEPEECFVSGPLATVLRLTRLVGIAPLQLVKQQGGWRARVSSSLTKFGYLMYTIVNLILMWTLFTNLVPHSKIPLRVMTQRLTLLVQGVVAVISLTPMTYGAEGCMRSVIASIRQVQKIYTKLNYQPRPWNRKLIWSFIFWTSFCTVMNMADYVMNAYHLIGIKSRSTTLRTSIAALYFFYHIFYSVLQLAMIQFSFLVLYISISFRAVNDSLRSLVQDDGISTAKSPTVHKVVREIASAYGTACDVIYRINHSHGPMVMILLIASFLHLIVNIYFFLSSFLPEHNNLYAQIREILSLFWSVFHVGNLMAIVEPCQYTHMEMEATRKLVSQLMHQTFSPYDPVMVQLDLFYKQLTLNNICYRPMNVFTISRKMLLAMIGSLTTYIVAITHIK